LFNIPQDRIILEGDVATVRALLRELAEAMGCNVRDVFTARPKAAPQTLPLASEPGLRDAFQRYAELSKLTAAVVALFVAIATMAMTLMTSKTWAGGLAPVTYYEAGEDIFLSQQTKAVNTGNVFLNPLKP
jgi:hypothetical protein